MTTITLDLKNSPTDLNKPELEQLLSDFIYDYIEANQDINLKNDLANDEEFAILNRKLEQKYAV